MQAIRFLDPAAVWGLGSEKYGLGIDAKGFLGCECPLANTRASSQVGFWTSTSLNTAWLLRPPCFPQNTSKAKNAPPQIRLAELALRLPT